MFGTLYSLKVHFGFNNFFFLTKLLQIEGKLLFKITPTETFPSPAESALEQLLEDFEMLQVLLVRS